MAYGNVNVSGTTQSEIEGVQQNIDNVKELIGQTANTSGSASAGTIMAKLNKLLTDWTTTRAGYIDTINTNAARLTSARATKLDNIGATGDTGGSTSAGTVMAKLNKLLTDWTTARAGKIDTISNNIGVTGDTGGSTSAGTAMAKMNASLQNDTDIKNLIGQTGNSGGTASAGTAMAKLNKLLTDWTTTRAGKIDTINTAIGTTAGTGGTATAGTVMSKLNALLSTVSSGVGIKSVQRGTFTEDFNVDTVKTTKITISSVNPAKTFVIINGGLSSGYSSSSSAVRGYVGAVTATSFTYHAGRASITIGAGQVSWQVVEFY